MVDKYKDSSQLMLIFCGSSMSYMEDYVLAYKAPFYGRRTAQMKILPFDFADTCRYFKNFSAEDKALVYGIVGGTPQYLLQMDDKLNVEDNIKNTFLNPTSSLFEEPENLLKQEVREPALYNAIITAIATGSSRMAEISSKVGESTSVCATYVKNLISLGIIRKETPYGERESRKSLYAIEDNMFRFWYRFVPGNHSMIARGAAELVYKRLEPQLLISYFGTAFAFHQMMRNDNLGGQQRGVLDMVDNLRGSLDAELTRIDINGSQRRGGQPGCNGIVERYN